MDINIANQISAGDPEVERRIQWRMQKLAEAQTARAGLERLVIALLQVRDFAHLRNQYFGAPVSAESATMAGFSDEQLLSVADAMTRWLGGVARETGGGVDFGYIPTAVSEANLSSATVLPSLLGQPVAPVGEAVEKPGPVFGWIPQ